MCAPFILSGIFIYVCVGEVPGAAPHTHMYKLSDKNLRGIHYVWPHDWNGIVVVRQLHDT